MQLDPVLSLVILIALVAAFAVGKWWALRRPDEEVIALLARGLLERLAVGIIPSQRGLANVERLCAHFPGMIDAHKPGGLTSRFARQRRIGQRRAGRRPFLASTGTGRGPQQGIGAF